MGRWFIIIQRKVIAALISGTLFTVLLGFYHHDPFGEGQIDSFFEFLFAASSTVTLYMMYSLPVILTYGVLTSIVSDKIGAFFSSKTERQVPEVFISGLMHAVFGFILLWISFAAACLFYMTDRILMRRRTNYSWADAGKSLIIPVLTWLIFLGVVWGREFLAGG